MGARLALCTGVMLIAVAGASAQQDVGSPKEQTPSVPANDANPAQEQGEKKPQSTPGGADNETPKQQAVPELPPVKVTPAPSEAKAQKATPRQGAAPATIAAPRGGGGAVQAPRATNASPAATAEQAALARNEAVMESAKTLNAARENVILPNIGVNSYDLDRQTIEDLPQGDNSHSIGSFCKPRAFPKIPPPAATFIFATSTPICSIASTESSFPTACPVSARCWKQPLSPTWRS